ncbi:hypothetical protein CYMTET_56338 [Cymbomonas tetramitiformis]|uniref:Isochorismatase-like domain-containing protein n=1 Tax=Cymbomonas tetramitiformis TaxID=36881 RepID=A0AAE0BCB4_9CHLO|nr:hypothetical protein CYMTET_56338 [Cymbomonas tetramitiformis]
MRGKLTPEKTCLFVCDVQELFRPRIHHMESLIHVTQYMMRGAKALKIPTIVTEQYPEKLGKTVKELQPHLTADVPNIPKMDFSMCVQDVIRHLQSMPAVKQVLLVGIEAHVCVLQTALDLLDLGYEVHLVLDAVSSQSPADREVAIQRMRDAGAYVTTSESALFQLLRSAKAPTFKAISNLAKEPRMQPQLGISPVSQLSKL